MPEEVIGPEFVGFLFTNTQFLCENLLIIS